MEDTHLTATADTIEAMVAELEERAAVAIEEDMMIDAVRIEARLKLLSRFVSGAQRAVGSRIARALPQRVNRVGPYEVECNFGRNRSKWQHDALFNEIVARTVGQECLGIAGARLVSEDGEVLGVSAEDVAERVGAELRAVLGIGYYRVKDMKARFGSSFDLDRYCESKESDPSITIRRMEKE